MTPLSGNYQELLSAFKSAGYEARSFHNMKPDQSHLILRHDIDICLNRALKIARVEAEFGWSATYFVLVSSSFYNVLENTSINALKEISDLGHEIGLHLDFTSKFGFQGDELEAFAETQAAVLSSASGQEIKTLSFHRPSANGAGSNYKSITFDSFVSAYDKAYFENIGYVSDSRGAWYYGHPTEHDAFKNRTAMQLLTHPVWWTGGEVKSQRMSMEVIASERAAADIYHMKDQFKINWDAD